MFVESPIYDLLLRGALLSAFSIFWVIVLVRIVGLRAFSKMTAFDFIVTIATGSLLANAATATSWSSFSQALIAMTSILAVQAVLALSRKSSGMFKTLIENEPRVLFIDGEWCEAAMNETRVDRSDVWAKMREANVLKIQSVRAVVLESTGDISVLHGDNFEEQLLTGVANKA